MSPAQAVLLALIVVTVGCTGNGTNGSGSSGSSGTHQNACVGTSKPAPDLNCSSGLAGAQVLANQAVEIDCSTSSAHPGYGIQVNLNGATVVDQLASSGRATITFANTSLKPFFSDTEVDVTLSVADCDRRSVASTQTLSYTLLGNVLVARPYDGTVDAYASDGSPVGSWLGSDTVTQPQMLARLNDGSILVGGTADATHPALQLFDANGSPRPAWDSVDHAAVPLWDDQHTPRGAAQDNQGRVWVSSFQSNYDQGRVLIFDNIGEYLQDAPRPLALNATNSALAPLGVAALPDGTVVIADGATDVPKLLLYPPQGDPEVVPLAFEVCSDDGQNVTCTANPDYFYGTATALLFRGGELAVTSIGDESSFLALFDPTLRFQRSTAHTNDTSTNDWGIYGANLNSVTAVGDHFVGNQQGYGCLLSLSGRTLDLDPDAGSYGCWNTDEMDLESASVVHLGP
jgi:hypothetical protein